MPRADPIRSEMRAAGTTAITLPAGPRPEDREGRDPRRSCRARSSGQKKTDTLTSMWRPSGRRGASRQQHEAALAQDVRAPCLPSDREPGAAVAWPRCTRVVHAETTRASWPARGRPGPSRPRRRLIHPRNRDGEPDAEADGVAEHLEEPDERRGEADLLGRDKVGDVALEGALGEVGAELEEAMNAAMAMIEFEVATPTGRRRRGPSR